MKNLIIILLTLVVTFGCNKEENNDTEITPILIGKNALFGDGEEGIDQSNLVIINSQDWTALIEQMDSVNNTSNDFTEIDIDFSEFQVIAVFDEIKGSGGSSINIIKIIENKDNITIFISSNSNDDLPFVNQPFHIIKIKKSEKPIIFVDEA
jgi:hypothetical protein